MRLVAEWLSFDCADPAALDYTIQPGDDPAEVAVTPRDGAGVKLLFVQVSDRKTIKNRLHFDLRPEEQAAEVERLLGLGAKKVDIGQGEQTWVVLADPEGNEFCVLRALAD